MWLGSVPEIIDYLSSSVYSITLQVLEYKMEGKFLEFQVPYKVGSFLMGDLDMQNVFAKNMSRDQLL